MSAFNTLKLFFIVFILALLSNLVFAQTEKDIIETDSTEEGINESPKERVAMLVGVENYLSNNITDLSYAVDDAQFIKNVLETQGLFSTIYLADDSQILPPTKENILNELDNIITLQELNVEIKTFLFYFTGHGFNTNNINYLAPMETDINDLAETALSFTTLMEKIKIIQNNGAKVVIFLDACRNDPETKKKGHTNDTWKDSNSTGTKIMYSTSKGDYSYEMNGHGVFTMFLVGALLGAADLEINGGNNDKFVSFEEAVKYTTENMIEWSQQTGYKQTPRTDGIEVSGDFLLTFVDELAFREPSYVQHLKIESVTFNGIVVTWQTDKETLGELFVSDAENFSINKAITSFKDLSTDGRKHKALITFEELDIKNILYIKSMDTDFIENSVLSDELMITKKDVYDVLLKEFNTEYSKLNGLIQLYETQKNFESAKLTCEETLNLIVKYNKILDLEKYKSETEEKLKYITDTALLSFIFVDFTMGMYSNFRNMSTVSYYLDIGLNFRTNRKLAFGVGISFLLNFEGFIKYSFINSYGLKNPSYELFLKGSILIDVYSIAMKDFGLGFKLCLGYAVNFNKNIALLLNGGVWTLFHFVDTHKFNVMPILSAGLIFYL